jgi:hypothetical protein
VPKTEGGLELKRLETWNQAAMLKHIWSLFSQAGSLGLLGLRIICLRERVSSRYLSPLLALGAGRSFLS